MRKFVLGSLLCLLLYPCFAATERAAVKSASAVLPAKSVPDSQKLEKDLQSLSWKQFRSVIEAIPPIRAEVNKYGPLGWQYVQQHYRTYPWKRSIDRLSGGQKIELARLIENARKPN
ncbi:MAG: hypothetical protein AB1443_11160 [Pseudomonadota bacterium]